MFERIAHKTLRFNHFRSRAGLARAILFELAWSFRRKNITIKLPGYPEPFFIRRFTSDVWCFNQIFMDRYLDAYLPESPKLIIDGGANVGFSTALYANHFPDAQIVAIEPSSSNCEMIKKNCRYYKNVRVIQAALWGHKTSLRITNPSDNYWCFVVEECEDTDEQAISAVSIQDILDESGHSTIDLLKLDIEGAERTLFSQGFESWLPRTKAMAIEIHDSEADGLITKAISDQDFVRSISGDKTFFIRQSTID